jgi:hypothetical protein
VHPQVSYSSVNDTLSFWTGGSPDIVVLGLRQPRVIMTERRCFANRSGACARLAKATRDPVQSARYRQLEMSWLYLFRLKARGRFAAAMRNRQCASLPL